MQIYIIYLSCPKNAKEITLEKGVGNVEKEVPWAYKCVSERYLQYS